MSLNGLPLALTTAGERVEVTAIAGSQDMRKRLGDLGVIVGKSLQVIQKETGGSMVVAVGETRFALGQGMAAKILVSPLKDRKEARGECKAEGPCGRRSGRRGWFR